jgi:hypothetical protein
MELKTRNFCQIHVQEFHLREARVVAESVFKAGLSIRIRIRMDLYSSELMDPNPGGKITLYFRKKQYCSLFLKEATLLLIFESKIAFFILKEAKLLFIFERRYCKNI